MACKACQSYFFCVLKPPGGNSTQWTLKSYDKGNSFTDTGPGFRPFNVIIEFNFLVQTLMIVVPKHFATILQKNTFPSYFLSFLADIPTKYLKLTCSFRILLSLNLLSIDDPGTVPQYSFNKHLSFYFSVKQS